MLCQPWHLITCVWFFPGEGSHRVVAGNSESWPHYIKLHPTPARAALFWALFLPIHISTIQPNVPTFVSVLFSLWFKFFEFLQVKSKSKGVNATKMQKYASKMKAEVLDTWIVGDTFLCVGFICLGSVSQVLPASHRATDTLHSRLILSPPSHRTHIEYLEYLLLWWYRKHKNTSKN